MNELSQNVENMRFLQTYMLVSYYSVGDTHSRVYFFSFAPKAPSETGNGRS